jgi:manganese/zinc/iron transport system permease protein
MIGLAALLGIGSCVIGYWVAVQLDASISGCMVMVLGGVFLITLILAPERGLLAGWLRRRRQRWEFAAQLLLVHLHNHEGKADEAVESGVQSIPVHLRWEADFAQKIILRADEHGWIQRLGDQLVLTERGRRAAEQVMTR